MNDAQFAAVACVILAALFIAAIALQAWAGG